MSKKAKKKKKNKVDIVQQEQVIKDAPDKLFVGPYDENLLERSNTQWQVGDWQSLTLLNRDTLQHHPDRTKLVLLAAAGRLQSDKLSEARQYIRLAQDWGVNKKLISNIVVAGVHNSLGRAAAIIGQQSRAMHHFENAITIGTPCADAKLLTQSSSEHQLNQIATDTLIDNGKSNPVLKHLDGAIHTILSQTARLKGWCSDDLNGIFEWRPDGDYHNFGDHLAILITKLIYTDQSWKRISSGTVYIYALVGSLLSNSNLNKLLSRGLRPVLIGCGYRGDKLDKELLDKCVVLGCRGPLSQSALKDAGIDTPWVGDPAMLIPLLFHHATLYHNNMGSSIFVPHVLDVKRLDYDEVCIGCDKIIQAKTRYLAELERIIYEISKAGFVLAGAMHAAIVACAYDIPFAFFDSKSIDCPPKWNDFAMSIGMSREDVKFYTNVRDGMQWYESIRHKIVKPKMYTLLQQFGKVGDIDPNLIRAALLYDYEKKAN